ncbi:aspartate racemase [Desulfatibacillum aliphaticivorans]|uniref:Aspartate racemase n=1 Tax=Desulfatibacillum aliphaticivorans TaxID=218208 RepID=B8FDC0_DESAL|nr:amino acid racemase [Desulfatibacillum aliphaticivorans]ACL06551.1 aspartate racemase [Desulfatibacillum aliphaticivorans]
MKQKIGIVGGLSPESTVSYYLYITRTYAERFGGYDYPEIIIYSVNLKKYHAWRSDDRWDLIADDLAASFQKLKSAGAEFGLIATNTMHKVFDLVAEKAGLPLINIIDETAGKAKELGLNKLGLLGTRYTMSDGFYQNRLSRFGLETVAPNPEQQEIIHNIIVEELVRGRFLEESKKIYLEIMEDLASQGAQGVILGCTEIPLLVKQEDLSAPLLDTAIIHAEAALKYALS